MKPYHIIEQANSVFTPVRVELSTEFLSLLVLFGGMIGNMENRSQKNFLKSRFSFTNLEREENKKFLNVLYPPLYKCGAQRTYKKYFT